MSELLDLIDKELKYTKEGSRDNEIGEYLLELVRIVDRKEGNCTSFQIKKILNKMLKIISSKVIIPLTLYEGEFIYKEPGLSVNRRNSSIKMDINGIYYENAYKIKIESAYDSFTGEYIINPQYEIFNSDRIYIRIHNKYTPYYFTKAYLYDKTIQKHSFTPRDPIIIKAITIINKELGIQFVDFNSSTFKTLSSCYNLYYGYDIDNKDILEKFNVNYKIKLDVIHTS